MNINHLTGIFCSSSRTAWKASLGRHFYQKVYTSVMKRPHIEHHKDGVWEMGQGAFSNYKIHCVEVLFANKITRNYILIGRDFKTGVFYCRYVLKFEPYILNFLLANVSITFLNSNTTQRRTQPRPA